MANRLAAATSPYLLQHAQNPVDWWEWEPAAFEEAGRREVPVLLSVGYAACHWCHDPDQFFTIDGFRRIRGSEAVWRSRSVST